MSARPWEELSEQRRRKVVALISLMYHHVGREMASFESDWAELDAMREGLDAAVVALQKAVQS